MMNPNDEDFRSGLKCAVHFLNDPPIQPNISKYPDFPKIIKLSPNFQLHTSYSPIFLGFFQFSYASRVHSNPVTIHSFIPPGASHALPMPLTPASPARRSLEAELFSPYGAEQSAAGQGNNQQLGRETIIIGLLSIIYSYIYIYLCIYIYINNKDS